LRNEKGARHWLFLKAYVSRIPTKKDRLKKHLCHKECDHIVYMPHYGSSSPKFTTCAFFVFLVKINKPLSNNCRLVHGLRKYTGTCCVNIRIFPAQQSELEMSLGGDFRFYHTVVVQ